MPPRVYEAHLKKSHTPEEVQGQIKKNDEEIKTIYGPPYTSEGQATTLVVKPLYGSCKCSFDWGEVYPCHSCGAEYPAKAMPWHAKQAHGV